MGVLKNIMKSEDESNTKENFLMHADEDLIMPPPHIKVHSASSNQDDIVEHHDFNRLESSYGGGGNP
jgi:hypothetical protein